MITIATFTVPEDAHLFRMFLESQGIESFIFDENFIQLFWHYSNAIGGVRVVVDEDDAEEAEAAYQEYMSSLRSGPYPEQPVRAWPAVALLTLIFGLPLLLFGRQLAKPKSPAK
jgi:Putative prokaryotic signal transducing protein